MTTAALLDLARHADILVLALSSRRGVCRREDVVVRLRHALACLEAARPWGDEARERVGRVVGAGERALAGQADTLDRSGHHSGAQTRTPVFDVFNALGSPPK